MKLELIASLAVSLLLFGGVGFGVIILIFSAVGIVAKTWRARAIEYNQGEEDDHEQRER